MSPTTASRALSVALVIAIGLLVGSWAGFLVWLDSHEAVDAIFRGGATFAGTVGLCLAVMAAYRQK